jgi:hypothetical protein
VRRRSPDVKRDWPTVVLPVLIAFQALFLVSEFSLRSYDYNVYQGAADLLLSGANPYDGAYLYPPLLAQVMGWGYRGIALLAPGSISASPQMIWDLVFYFYRCLQFFLFIAAYWLCYRFSYELGMSKMTSLIVVTVLFAANTPILRTMRHNQVNLLVLNLALVAILALRRWPFIGGLFLSLGGLIKLYPFFLALPWLMLRKWKALAGVVTCVAVVLVAQLSFGRGLTVWWQFASSLTSMREGNVFRDNSLRGLLVNTARLAGASNLRFVNGLVLVLTAGCGLLFLWRSWKRVSRAAAGASDPFADLALSHGLAADALGFMILLSPLVWEHHFVLILPLSIWALSVHKREHFWPIVLANVLVYLLPTFDLFPLSYHRLVGLCLLLYFTAPRSDPLVRTLG